LLCNKLKAYILRVNLFQAITVVVSCWRYFGSRKVGVVNMLFF